MKVVRFLVASMAGCGFVGCESGEAPPVPSSSSFIDVTAERGITWSADRGQAGDAYMPDSMTGGCALFDANGDGRLDIYVVNGVRGADGERLSASGMNRLFVQQADGRFADETDESGLGDASYGMGVAVGDYDGDGDPDVYLANHGPDRLYRNDGGRFVDVSRESGILNDTWSASVGFFDPDRDGDLDVFVTNYVAFDPLVKGERAGGQPEYPSPLQFGSTVDTLYINDGDGTFTDATESSGLASGPGKGLGVAFLDLDGDALVDAYVANDGMANRAWINQGDGTFRDDAMQRGLAVNLHGIPEAGMGIALGDIDGNGLMDLIITHLTQETNTAYFQEAPGRWTDGTVRSGLGAPSIDFTAFGAALADFDHDGDLDFVVANGRVLRGPVAAGVDLPEHWRGYGEPNQFFRNDGERGFLLDDDQGGTFATNAEVSRGLAVGDLDDDGDLDLVIINANGTVRVFANELTKSGSWLRVRPRRTPTANVATGASVTLVLQSGLLLRRSIGIGGSYLTHIDDVAHFGIPAGARIESIRVEWPDGTAESFTAPSSLEQVIEVIGGTGTPQGDST